MKRFHSHKSGTVWTGEKVRYFFCITSNSNDERYLKAQGEDCYWMPRGSRSGYSTSSWLQDVPDERFIEVQEADLPYLKKPEGEWEFRRPEKGTFTQVLRPREDFDGGVITHGFPADQNPDNYKHFYDKLEGYRWCKPVKVKPPKRDINDPSKWAEGLIEQLSTSHNGRNSWLLNFGLNAEAHELRDYDYRDWKWNTHSNKFEVVK